MLRLLDMLFAARRQALAEEAAKPWRCPECGKESAAGEARRHLVTHRARIVSEEPLIVELRCWDAPRDLGAAVAELKRRWPGRKFQLVGAAYGEDMRGGGPFLRSVLAVEDDWIIPHQPL
jgi:hypothetical protein